MPKGIGTTVWVDNNDTINEKGCPEGSLLLLNQLGCDLLKG